MVASLDPSGDETDEDKRVTDSSLTTKSTNDDDNDDSNNNNNKKQERVIDEDKRVTDSSSTTKYTNDDDEDDGNNNNYKRQERVIDEDKRVTDSSSTTKSTNDDDDDDGNNNNNKKQERVIIGKEDNYPSISPAFIQKNNGTIPFIPKMHRNKNLSERIKLRAAETRTKSFNQQNTALNDMMSISQSSQNISLLLILDDTRFPVVNNFRSTLQQHLQKKGIMTMKMSVLRLMVVRLVPVLLPLLHLHLHIRRVQT
jgi:hypothetical protein